MIWLGEVTRGFSGSHTCPAINILKHVEWMLIWGSWWSLWGSEVQATT